MNRQLIKPELQKSEEFFKEYWGEEFMYCGLAILPQVLLDYRVELNLSHAELYFIEKVFTLSFRGLLFIKDRDISNYNSTNVNKIRKRLKEKGYLDFIVRDNEDRNRGVIYDFSGLKEAVSELVKKEKKLNSTIDYFDSDNETPNLFTLLYKDLQDKDLQKLQNKNQTKKKENIKEKNKEAIKEEVKEKKAEDLVKFIVGEENKDILNNIFENKNQKNNEDKNDSKNETVSDIEKNENQLFIEQYNKLHVKVLGFSLLENKNNYKKLEKYLIKDYRDRKKCFHDIILKKYNPFDIDMLRRKLQWVKIKDLAVGDYVAYPLPEYHEQNSVIIDLADYLDYHCSEKYVYISKSIKTDEFIEIYEFIENNDLQNKKYKYNELKTMLTAHNWNRKTFMSVQSALLSKKGIERVNRYIELTPELSYAIGLYLAEGYDGNSRISFCLHEKEYNLFKRAYNGIAKQIKPTSYTWQHSSYGHGSEGYIFSRPIAKFFRSLIGKYCYNKMIPEIFWNAPKECVLRLIEGYFDGDGCICVTSKTKAFNIVGCNIFLDKYENILINNCTNNNKVKRYVYKNRAIGNFTYGGIKRLTDIYNFLYNNATIFLERKKKKFELIIMPS